VSRFLFLECKLNAGANYHTLDKNQLCKGAAAILKMEVDEDEEPGSEDVNGMDSSDSGDSD
jgi:hypothetical protein